MDENIDQANVFGKAIGQLIHDIRNPLNTIIGFSSIIQIDEKVDDEVKEYVKKIFQSGMAIEKLLSNIDFFMMHDIETEKISIEVLSATKAYINTLLDIINEKQITIDYIADEKLNIFFSLDIFNKIIDNLFQFSLKGLRSLEKKEIQFLFKKENDTLIFIFSDSSSPVFIEGNYFTFDEVLKSKRGLSVMFIEKYIKNINGEIEYKYGKNWQNAISIYNAKLKSNHGFIMKLPVIKK